MKKQWIEFVLVVTLCFFYLIAVKKTTPLIEHKSGYDNDGLRYAAMIHPESHPEELSKIPPFCWRILTPFLVSKMPFSTIRNFLWIAFFSDWAALVMLYFLLRRLKLTILASSAGLLFYAGVFWTIKFSFYSPCYVDHQANMLTILALFLMVYKKYWGAPLVMLIGVAQKESILFLVPVILFSYIRDFGWQKKTWFYAAFLILPAMLVFFLIRHFIQPIWGYSPFQTLFRWIQTLLKPLTWYHLLIAIFSGLGILPALLILWRRSVFVFLKTHLEWTVLIGLGVMMLFGGIDKARLFIYMLPGLIVALTAAFDANQLITGKKEWTVLFIVIALSAHFYLGHYFSPMGSYADYLDRMVPTHADGSLIPALIRSVLVYFFLFIFLGIIFILQRMVNRTKQA